MLNLLNRKHYRSAIVSMACSLLLTFTFSGCEQVQSEFVYSEATEQLIPAAQESVKQSLLTTFGTPADPTIPAYFPVDRGGIVVTMEDFDPDNPTEILLEPPGSPTQQGLMDQIAVGSPVQFLFDPEDAFDVRAEAAEEELPDPLAFTQNLQVAKIDPETQLLSLNRPLPTELDLIEPGLELAVNANEHLRLGGQLYAQHCLHCHGVTGDGNGPTAQFMTPKPRDYRLGVFKFTSTGPQDKISTADLKHLLKEGIAGTYMPAFNMLSETELDLIIAYVKFLSLRGEAERNLDIEVGVDFAQAVLDEELEDAEDQAERDEIQADFLDDYLEFATYDYPEIELGVLLDLADSWAAADEDDAVLLPGIPRPDPNGPSPDNPELTSIENGRQLYLGKDAQCASCHGDAGRGNGYQSFQFQKKQDGSLYDVVGLHDAWGNPLPPRNLTRGVYRGGRRPIDLYRRIYAGIKGTPMPVFGGKGLSDEQIWDIVNYVLTMPVDVKPLPPKVKAEADLAVK